MKKSKKIVTGLICAVMAFSSILPIYAVEERGQVAHCGQCIEGTLYAHVTRTPTANLMVKPCGHNKKGYDVYREYKVTTELRCNKCTFTDTSPNVSYEFKFENCYGVNE